MLQKQYNIKNFNIESLIERAERSTYTFEYNCDMRRVVPLPDKVNTKRNISEFGMIIVQLKENTNVDAHEHDEEELFFITKGEARLKLEGQSAKLFPGDYVYIPRYWNHQMCNEEDSLLEFVDIYWDFLNRNKEEYLRISNG